MASTVGPTPVLDIPLTLSDAYSVVVLLGKKVAAEGTEFVTKEKSGGFDVKSAQVHGVVAAEFVLVKGTTRDDTWILKKITWGATFPTLQLKEKEAELSQQAAVSET